MSVYRVTEVIGVSENGGVKNFRVRLGLSFKYDTGD
jgi:flavin-binding protein dodecin